MTKDFLKSRSWQKQNIMNNRTINYRDIFGIRSSNPLKLQNDLKIERPAYLRDTTHNNLIVLVESNMGLTQDVNIYIRGSIMIIEAVRDLDYEKPFRSRLIQKELMYEFENRGLEAGFSELQLDRGYKYELLSHQVISPGLLKVILSYEKINKKQDLYN